MTLTDLNNHAAEVFLQGVRDVQLSPEEEKGMLTALFSCIDHTSLNGTDTEQHIRTFCADAVKMRLPQGEHVAAVCVYPSFVALAKSCLKDSAIKVAAVTGGFPHGQLPLSLKVDEVCYAVEQGADEVDFVINRGYILSGEDKRVTEEVMEAKKACGNSHLKVIIESGELPDLECIYKTASLVLDAGADFVKTSTGKIPVGATPEAAFAMINAVYDFVKKQDKKVGFKAAGGISTPLDALMYMQIMKKILNVNFVNNQVFRIGTSRLTTQLYKILTQ